jgi:TIR domain
LQTTKAHLDLLHDIKESMTLAEAKELEQLKLQEAASERAKALDEKQKEADLIDRRSGAWHKARTDLVFARIEGNIDDRLAIRRDLIERCPDLATAHETRQFEERSFRIVEDQFQAALQSFHVMGVRPPAGTLSQVATRKLALQQKIRVVSRMLQLQVNQAPRSNPLSPMPPAEMSAPFEFRFEVALSFPGENRPRVERIAELLAVNLGRDKILYDQWHRAEFARPNLDVYLPRLYHEDSLLLVFFLSGNYAQKEWCGLEWRAGRDLLKQKKDERLMFLRIDHADIPGIYSIDGYIDISQMPDQDVAGEILKRLAILREQQIDATPSWGPIGHHPEKLRIDKPGVSMPAPEISKEPPAFVTAQEYWAQRKRLPESELVKRFWQKPRWCIWSRPEEFRKARFRNLDHCSQFVGSANVRSRSRCSQYPWISNLEQGDESIANEVEIADDSVKHFERWVLFQSGQFVHNMALDQIPQLGDRTHALEILDTTTAVFEFVGRMAERKIFTNRVAVGFELKNVAGRQLTWPRGHALDGSDRVNDNAWCQEDIISIDSSQDATEMINNRRRLALELAIQIYSKFGWNDPPKEELEAAQRQRFGQPIHS